MNLVIVSLKNSKELKRVKISANYFLDAVVIFTNHARKQGFDIWRRDPDAIGGSHFEKEDGTMMYLKETNKK